MINNSDFNNYYTLTAEQSGQVFSKVLEFFLLDPYDQVTTTITDGYNILMNLIFYFIFNIFFKELQASN